MTLSSNKIKILPIIIFSAISVAMSLIKTPGPSGSIALDSATGFFTAVFFHPIVGAFVGLIGHFGSAATSGFPFGGLHIWVALQMFLWCFLFGYISKIRPNIFFLLLGGVVAVFLNGVIAPIILVYTPFFNLDISIAKSLIPYLTFAALVNVVVAISAYVLIIRTKIPNL